MQECYSFQYLNLKDESGKSKNHHTYLNMAIAMDQTYTIQGQHPAFNSEGHSWGNPWEIHLTQWRSLWWENHGAKMD